MKDTTDKNEIVLGYIKSNPGSTIESITEGTRISNLLVRKAIKQLQGNQVIQPNDEDGGFSVTEKPSKEKVGATASENEDEGDLGPKHAPGVVGRDNRKFRFQDERQLPKGRLVLALVKAYIAKNPRVTLPKLKEVFMDKEIQPRFGVCEDLKVARAFSKNNVDRFFLKNDDIIKLGNGTKVAVCSQWTSESLAKILKICSAAPMNFKVKVETAE